MSMSNICKTVTLRTRKIKGGEQLSFYLDYYPGYRDEGTMKVMRPNAAGEERKMRTILHGLAAVLRRHSV